MEWKWHDLACPCVTVAKSKDVGLRPSTTIFDNRRNWCFPGRSAFDRAWQRLPVVHMYTRYKITSFLLSMRHEGRRRLCHFIVKGHVLSRRKYIFVVRWWKHISTCSDAIARRLVVPVQWPVPRTNSHSLGYTRGPASGQSLWARMSKRMEQCNVVDTACGLFERPENGNGFTSQNHRESTLTTMRAAGNLSGPSRAYPNYKFCI